MNSSTHRLLMVSGSWLLIVKKEPWPQAQGRGWGKGGRRGGGRPLAGEIQTWIVKQERRAQEHDNELSNEFWFNFRAPR